MKPLIKYVIANFAGDTKYYLRDYSASYLDIKWFHDWTKNVDEAYLFFNIDYAKKRLQDLIKNAAIPEAAQLGMRVEAIGIQEPKKYWTDMEWLTLDGRSIPVPELTNEHLINIVRHIKWWNTEYPSTYPVGVIGVIWTECLHRDIDPTPLTPNLWSK
jgi:hypothetical protein